MEQRNEQTFRNYVCNTAHNLLGYRLRKIGRVSTDKKLVLCNILIGHYSTVQQEKAFSVEPDQPSQIPSKPAQAGFIFVLFAKSARGTICTDALHCGYTQLRAPSGSRLQLAVSTPQVSYTDGVFKND